METQTAVGATTREDPLTGSRVQTSVEPLLERSAVLTNSQGLGTAGRVSSSRSRNGRVDRDVKNGMFVEFNHTRWYASAPPQSIDPARLRPIGDWHGFPVYTAPSTGESTIYIPIALGVDALAASSRRK